MSSLFQTNTTLISYSYTAESVLSRILRKVCQISMDVEDLEQIGADLREITKCDQNPVTSGTYDIGVIGPYNFRGRPPIIMRDGLRIMPPIHHSVGEPCPYMTEEFEALNFKPALKAFAAVYFNLGLTYIWKRDQEGCDGFASRVLAPYTSEYLILRIRMLSELSDRGGTYLQGMMKEAYMFDRFSAMECDTLKAWVIRARLSWYVYLSTVITEEDVILACVHKEWPSDDPIFLTPLDVIVSWEYIIFIRDSLISIFKPIFVCACCHFVYKPVDNFLSFFQALKWASPYLYEYHNFWYCSIAGTLVLCACWARPLLLAYAGWKAWCLGVKKATIADTSVRMRKERYCSLMSSNWFRFLAFVGVLPMASANESCSFYIAHTFASSVGLTILAVVGLCWLNYFILHFMKLSREIRMADAKISLLEASRVNDPNVVAESIPCDIPYQARSPESRPDQHWIWKFLILFNIIYRLAEWLMSTRLAKKMSLKAMKIVDDALPKSDNHKKFDDALRRAAATFDKDVYAESGIVSENIGLVELFCDQSLPKVLLTYLTAVFTCPNYKVNPNRCIANLSASTIAFMSAVHTNTTPHQWNAFLTIIRNGFGDPEAIAESGSFSESTLESIASSFDGLSRFKDNPVSKIMRNFATLLLILPITFYKFEENDLRMYWDNICRKLEITGTCISGILRGVASIHSRLCIDGMAGGSSVLRSLFVNDTVHTCFVEAQSLERSVMFGTVDKHMHTDDILDIFRTCDSRCQNVANRANATPFEKNRALRSREMLDKYTLMRLRGQSRTVPFCVRLVGPAGIGKTEVLTSLIFSRLHEWMGISEIASVSTIDVTQQWDNQTNNGTTAILLDDQGNVTVDKRAKTLSSALLTICQGRFSEVPKPFEDKGTQFYQNWFIGMSDNTAVSGVDKEVYCPLAALRRFGICANVSVKPDFLDSKQLLNVNHPDLDAYGSHLMFEPYEWGNDSKGNYVPHPILHKGKRLLDVYEYLQLLKERCTSHFDRQRDRNRNAMILKSEELCPVHRIMPISKCAECKVDLPVAEAVVDFFPLPRVDNVITRVKKTVFLSIAHYLRQRLLNQSSIAKFADFALQSINPPLVFGTIFGMILYFSFKMTPDFISSFLICSIAGFGVCWLIVRDHYMDLISMSDEEAARQRAALNERWPSYCLVLAISAAVFASATLWNTVVNVAFPDDVAESMIITDLVDEVKIDTHAWKVVDSERHATSLNVEPRTATLEQLLSIVDHCTATGRLWCDDTHIANSITFLTPQIFVTVGHAIKERVDMCVFEMTIGTGEGAPTRRFSVRSHQIWRVPGKDLALVYCPTPPFGPRKSLKKYLPNSKPTSAITVARYWVDEGVARTVKLEAIPCKRQKSYVCYNRDGSETTIECSDLFVALSSSYTSRGGECGCAYIQVANPKVIAGFHCAGGNQALDHKFYFVPLTIGEFEAAEDAFRELNYLPPPDVEKIPDFIMNAETKLIDEIPTKHPFNFLDSSLVDPFIHGSTPANFTPRTDLQVNPHLEHAVVCLGLKRRKGKPVMRWKRSTHKVLRNALAPKNDGNHLIMADSLRSFVADTSESIRFDDILIRRPLSFEEVLNGIPGTPYSCLKLDKAAGWPMFGKKSKWITIVSDTERIASQELIDEVRAIECRLFDGKPTGNVATACLKDEPVKIEKLYEARLFYANPLPELIVHGKYLRPILELITSNYVHFNTSIGVDPTGQNAFPMLEHVMRPDFVENGFDIDYAAFDCNQSPGIRTHVMTLLVELARLIGYSDDDLDMVRRICASLICPTINFMGVVATVPNLLSSGFLGTAHVNGLVTLLLFRYDFETFMDSMVPGNMTRAEWLKLRWKEYTTLTTGCTPIFNDHSENINVNGFYRITTLGDDVLGTASGFYRMLGWTPAHIAATAASWGLEMTDGEKGKNFSFKHITNCEFLRRHYYYNRDICRNALVAGPSSFLRPFFLFLKGKEYEEGEYQSSCLRDVLREAAFSGRQCFEYWYSRVKEYVSKSDLPEFIVLHYSYDDWVSLIVSDSDWMPQPQLVECSETGLRLAHEYAQLRHEFDEHGRPAVYAETGPEANSPLTSDDTPAGATGGGTFQHPNLLYDTIANNTQHHEFLQRRYLLSTFEWSNAGISGKDLVYIRPFYDLLKIPYISDRLNYAAFLHFDIEITIEMVAPSTMAGAMLASVHYAPEASSAINSSPDMATLCQWSQKEGIVMHCGNAAHKYTLRVPYRFIDPMIATHDLSTWSNLCSVSFFNLVPLMSSMADVTPSVTVNVYCNIHNLKTSGATVIPKPGPTNGMVAETLEKRMKPLEEFGAPKQSLHRERFTRTWSLIGMRDFSSEDQYGAVIDTFNVTPAIFVNSLKKPQCSQPASCAIPTLFYNYWRGTMEYRVEIVAPKMVIGRLQIKYDPLSLNTGGLVDPHLTPDLNEHILFDCAKTPVQEFSVHYAVPEGGLRTLPIESMTGPELFNQACNGGVERSRGWRNVAPDRFEDNWLDLSFGSATHHSGRVEISVQSPLLSSSGLKITARVLLYARCGADMHFWGYTGGLPTNVDVVMPACVNAGVQSFQFPNSDMYGGLLVDSNRVGATSVNEICQDPIDQSPPTQPPIANIPDGGMCPVPESPGFPVPNNPGTQAPIATNAPISQPVVAPVAPVAGPVTTTQQPLSLTPSSKPSIMSSISSMLPTVWSSPAPTGQTGSSPTDNSNTQTNVGDITIGGGGNGQQGSGGQPQGGSAGQPQATTTLKPSSTTAPSIAATTAQPASTRPTNLPTKDYGTEMPTRGPVKPTLKPTAATAPKMMKKNVIDPYKTFMPTSSDTEEVTDLPTFEGTSAIHLAPPKDHYPPTSQPTCVDCDTGRPSTSEPSSGPTVTPTSANPTTDDPTSFSPTSSNPTTLDPTTGTPTSAEPTTLDPTTGLPTSALPTTLDPTTALPTSSNPTSSNPTPDPTSFSPTSSNPTTLDPTTGTPTSAEPTTLDPTTGLPTSALPTTLDPTTALPTSSNPTSSNPTPDPTSGQPTGAPTPEPSTAKPTPGPTGSPSSGAPATAGPTTTPTSGAPSFGPITIKTIDGRVSRDGFGLIDYVTGMDVYLYNTGKWTGSSPGNEYVMVYMVPNSTINAVVSTGYGIGAWNTSTVMPSAYSLTQTQKPITPVSPSYAGSSVGVWSNNNQSAIGMTDVKRSTLTVKAPPIPGKKYQNALPPVAFMTDFGPGGGVLTNSYLSINIWFVLSHYFLGIQYGVLYSEIMPANPGKAIMEKAYVSTHAEPHRVPVTNVKKQFAIPNGLNGSEVASLLAKNIDACVFGLIYNGTDPGYVETQDGRYNLDTGATPYIKTGIFRFSLYDTSVKVVPGNDLWVYCVVMQLPTGYYYTSPPGMTNIPTNPSTMPLRPGTVRRLGVVAEAGPEMQASDILPAPTITEAVAASIPPVPHQSTALGMSRGGLGHVKAHLGDVGGDFFDLLKTPCLAARCEMRAGGLFPMPLIFGMYQPLARSDTQSLYWYMTMCFETMRGGIVWHYSILGQASLEVRQISSTGGIRSLGLRGAKRASTFTNPHLTVETPYHYIHSWVTAQGSWDTPDSLEQVIFYCHNGVSYLNIERSVADDFALHGFRGAAMISWS
jgi:hypothetical protein